ncbi:MAG: hypothetical protein J5372_08390 [Lachnospiraceae bacterium]|nr:hypothetical protein [Lachnospiraceae bacterium]
MSDNNSYNGYSSDSDKCPNCGAMKIFSALVCPACGMSYSDAAAVKKKEAEAKSASTSFDLNASFANYKKKVDGEVDAAETVVETVAEETKRATQDQAPVNSGLYGERKYRVSDDGDETPIMGISDKRPEGEPDQTVVPTRYGLDSETVKNKREQSLTNEAAKQKMFSTTVSNRYEQYKNDREGSYDKPSYATPYNRGSFDSVPEDKPSILKKIIPLAIVLILVLSVGFLTMKYVNRNKNDNGVEYNAGKATSTYYTNDWSELKIKFDNKMQDSGLSIIGIYNSIYKSVSEKMGYELEINLLTVYNGNPAIMVLSYAKSSFFGKIFGIDEDEFLSDEELSKSIAQGTGSFRREADIVLSGHTYKVVSSEVTSNVDGTSGRGYMCVRRIGNRLNIVMLYEFPGISLTTLKQYFEDYR